MTLEERDYFIVIGEIVTLEERDYFIVIGEIVHYVVIYYTKIGN
jgi:K+/H+ antiporter YhaU regulatory subunit KhtT